MVNFKNSLHLTQPIGSGYIFEHEEQTLSLEVEANDRKQSGTFITVPPGQTCFRQPFQTTMTTNQSDSDHVQLTASIPRLPN